MWLPRSYLMPAARCDGISSPNLLPAVCFASDTKVVLRSSFLPSIPNAGCSHLISNSEEHLRVAWGRQWLKEHNRGGGIAWQKIWAKTITLIMFVQSEPQASFSPCSLFQYLLEFVLFWSFWVSKRCVCSLWDFPSLKIDSKTFLLNFIWSF